MNRKIDDSSLGIEADRYTGCVPGRADDANQDTRGFYLGSAVRICRCVPGFPVLRSCMAYRRVTVHHPYLDRVVTW